MPVTHIPKTPEDFKNLKNLSPSMLRELGCIVWETKNEKTHWLYPYQWYDHIPNGLSIVDINGKEELFEKGKTDDDRRMGMLAYGFLQDTIEEENG